RLRPGPRPGRVLRMGPVGSEGLAWWSCQESRAPVPRHAAAVLPAPPAVDAAAGRPAVPGPAPRRPRPHARPRAAVHAPADRAVRQVPRPRWDADWGAAGRCSPAGWGPDRKSTRLNSSHVSISYAV